MPEEWGREHCEACGVETSHDVRVEIREESSDPDAERRSYSREPYRIVECQRCGEETATRMNNQRA